LKVRLITKGSAYPQWISRFFQKSLWGYLQKFPQFALTGRPMDVSDLMGILLRERSLETQHQQLYGIPMFRDPKWVSGDYSSATDRMSVSATKVLIETFLSICNYSEDIEDVLRSVIYEQKIHYPSRFVKNANKCWGCSNTSCEFCYLNGQPLLEEEMINQSNGQLMGSVLSFPILCLTNLICYWAALEERTGLKINPLELPVLVNGDDILFRADEDLLEIWERRIKQCGFQLSLGKNYVHESVLMVNSEMYVFSESQSGVPHFRHIPFFNVGLLTGQSKLTGRTETREMPLPAVWNEVVPGACNELRALKRFIHYQKEDVLKWTNKGNYNLFIPVWRGGLGMIPPAHLSFNITSFQQRVAGLIRLKQLEAYNLGQLPKGLATGIVRIVEGEILTFKHFYHLQEVQYGPLLPGQKDPINIDVKVPPLAETFDLEASMKLRFPKNLNLIRSGEIPRMSFDLIEQPPPRLVEYNPYEVDLQYLMD